MKVVHRGRGSERHSRVTIAMAADGGADAVTATEEDFHQLLGAHVTITGLKAKPELNGTRGRVMSFDHKAGRAGVKVGSEHMLSIKPSNLKPDAAKSDEAPAPELVDLSLDEAGAAAPKAAVTAAPSAAAQSVAETSVAAAAPGAAEDNSASLDAPLLRIWSARDRLASLGMDSDKLPNAREDLADAVQALLSEVGANDVGEVERRALDGALSPHAAELKGALLKALRVVACARGFLGLPALMEETRKLLCAAPAKGVATYVEEALCADITRCHDRRTLAAVVDLMAVMSGNSLETGKPRLKKDLGGADLPPPHKKSCRTALNRAAKGLEALEAAARKEQQASGGKAAASARRSAEMDRDVRLDDADDAARRAAAHQSGMDALFSQALGAS